jgi:glycosyltransferase involved in cell wall biosynthesis
MKVLVTGTDGYIGTVLAPMLMARGHDVIGLDTGFYREGWLYNHSMLPRPRCINKDIRQLQTEPLTGFDAVIHLAELSNDPLGQLNPDITYQINYRGTTELARLCKRSGIGRFIYTSSCSVYGAGAVDYCTEETLPNPQTAYAKCKVLVERELRAMAEVPTVRLEVIGDGPEGERLRALAEDLAVADRVHFAGRQPREGVLDALARAEAVVIPSKVGAGGDQDGTPVVLCEAMAAGVPVVASALGGLAECVVDGETGILVPPDDVTALRVALERLVDGTVDVDTLGKASAESARDLLDIGAIGRQYDVILGDAAAR